MFCLFVCFCLNTNLVLYAYIYVKLTETERSTQPLRMSQPPANLSCRFSVLSHYCFCPFVFVLWAVSKLSQVIERLYPFIALIVNTDPPKSVAGVLDHAIWLLHGWCHVKLLPFRRKFCVHHYDSTTDAPAWFTASLHSKPRVYVCTCDSPSLSVFPSFLSPGMLMNSPHPQSSKLYSFTH